MCVSQCSSLQVSLANGIHDFYFLTLKLFYKIQFSVFHVFCNSLQLMIFFFLSSYNVPWLLLLFYNYPTFYNSHWWRISFFPASLANLVRWFIHSLWYVPSLSFLVILAVLNCFKPYYLPPLQNINDILRQLFKMLKIYISFQNSHPDKMIPLLILANILVPSKLIDFKHTQNSYSQMESFSRCLSFRLPFLVKIWSIFLASVWDNFCPISLVLF